MRRRVIVLVELTVIDAVKVFLVQVLYSSDPKTQYRYYCKQGRAL